VAEKATREQITELKELLIAYFKQETIDPLKGLARYVGFGLLGASLIGTGICFLAIGGLRALQTETGTTFQGHWTWAPYGITVAALMIIAVAAISRARSPRSSR
jgi:membrane protein implicated in regulation of membrane protease activity